MPERCPSQECWKEHLDGTLPADEQAVLTEHLDGCADCRKTLEMLAGGSDSLLDVARHAGQATDASTTALNEVLAKFQAPPSETQAEPADARDDSLSFLTPSEKPGCLGRLGHYEVQEVVGKGGFGIVLKAFDEKLHRVVAIKVLSPAYAAIGSARKRFIREAQSAAAVKNEHVVAIYSVKDETQPPYLVMELIDGISLQDKLDQKGSLSLKEILRIGLQTAEGLAAAHKQGLVHRDIKPANILLENGVERVRITDFGLARAVDDATMTQSGTVAGTPMYMSPEQAEGLAIDHRSDLFSLGTVLYAMCTGHPPFRASGTHAVLKRVIDASPRPIREFNNEIPDWLCNIIAKLHAKTPGERFQTAKEVAELLGKHLAHTQQPSQTPLPAPTVMPTALVPGSVEPPKAQPMVAPGLALVFWPTLIGLFLGAFAGSALKWSNPTWLSEWWGIDTSLWLGIAYGAGLGAWLGVLVGLTRWVVAWRISWEVRKARKNDEAGPVATASFPAASRRPVRLAGIVLVIAAVVMVPCMIPAGIVLYVLSSNSSRDPNVGVPPQEGHNLILIRDDPTISLFVNPEQGGQNGFIFDGLEFGTVLPPGRYQVQGRKNDSLVFQQWVTLDTKLRTTVHVHSGWVQFFNGNDLTGWKLNPADKDVWRVKDGILVGQGAECSMLPSERGDFRDFHLRVEAMINDGGDSGVWFRTDLKSQDGYEANINHSHRDPARTGSLGMKKNHMRKWLHHQNNSPAPANTWFTLEVIGVGPNFTVKVDGVTVAQVTDTNRSAGHIGLEMFEKKSIAHFRKIEIKELPPIGAPPLAVAPFDQQKAKTHQDASAEHLGVEPEITNSIGMKLRLIPPGEFMMGSSPEEIAWLLTEVPDLKDASDNIRSEGPQRRVTVKEPFYMGVHEVTVGHFRKIVCATKYRTEAETEQGGIIWNNEFKKWERKPEYVWDNAELSGGDTDPVVFVTLADAQAFCAWLTKQEGRAYAVPAEEQWEWACRAGATTRWFFGNDVIAMKDFGWTTPRSEGKLKPVGQLAPNPFGLYDIYGNANELTMNLQQQAVGRGGEAGESPHRARSASRFVIEKQYDPSYRRGFRVVIVGDLKAKATPAEPWVPLFNGMDLTGWQTDQPDKWKVENGAIIGYGGKGYLVLTDTTFENFHCRLEAKINADSWGGLAFRHSAESHGNVSICPKLGKTGSLFYFNKGKNQLLQEPQKQLAAPDTWLNLELIVQGKNVVVLVNGTKTAEASIDGLPDRGPIELCADAAGTVIHFRKIEIKELPATKK